MDTEPRPRVAAPARRVRAGARSWLLPALAAVLLAVPVRAAWQSLSLPGTPRDVQVMDAGHYAVATSLNVHELRDTSEVRTLLQNQNMVGANLDPSGCLVGVNSNGRLYFSCRADYQSEPVASLVGWQRLASTWAGSGYMNVRQTSASVLLYSPTGGVAADDWTRVTGVPLQTVAWESLSAHRAAGVDFALVGVKQPATQNVLFLQNGAVDPTRSFATVAIEPEETRLFGTRTGLWGGLMAGAGGVEVVDFRVSPPQSAAASLPAGTLSVVGLSFTVGDGDLFGEGHGLAAGRTGTGGLLLVPVPDPARPGQTWVAHGSAPGGVSPDAFTRVSCFGAQTCVALTNLSAGNNVFVYQNAAPPTVSPPAPLTLDEGAPPQSVNVDATDPDGDAVFVTWVPDATPAVVDVQRTSADGRQVTLAVPESELLCGTTSTPRTYSVVVSDGLASHRASASVNVTVRHTVPPAPPTLSAASVSVPAGSAPFEITASRGATGCAPERYAWSSLNASPVTLTPQNGPLFDRARVEVPRNLCQVAPAVADYRVDAIESGRDAGSALRVEVTGWGPPEDPYPGGGEARTQTSGEGQWVNYAPAATHVCSGGAFPGVTTRWHFDGGTAVPGVEVAVGGVPQSQSPAVGPVLEVRSTQDCVSGRLTFRVVNEVQPGGQSDAGTLTIDFAPVLTPIGGSTQLALDAGYAFASGRIEGSVSTNLNCPQLRTLESELTVQREDGTPASSPERLAVPAPFSVPVPSGCAGGTFRVAATLLENGVATSVTSTTGPLVTPLRPAEVGPVDGALVARCGDGATGTLALGAPDAGSCQTAGYGWVQTGGPALVGGAWSGAQIGVASESQAPHELVGQTVRFAVTADAGGGNSVTAERTVRISAQPDWVKVDHRVDPPAGSEAELVRVTIGLTNTTSCELAGVTFRELLDGLSYVPGSGRYKALPAGELDGQGGLVFNGLHLPPGEQVWLAYSARARLLSRARPRGVALLGPDPAVAISPERGLGAGVAPTCGCAQGGSPLVLVLGLLMLTLRRRAGR